MQQVHQKVGKVALILPLVIIFLLFIPPYMLEDLSLHPWFSALTHHFFHANVAHLAVNCICIWAIYNSHRAFKALPLAFIFATLSYFVALKPVIGFSNILFATMGTLTPSLHSKWWKSQSAIVFLAVTVLTALVPNISGTTHIASFVLGVVYACARRTIMSTIKDLNHVSR